MSTCFLYNLFEPLLERFRGERGGRDGVSFGLFLDLLRLCRFSKCVLSMRHFSDTSGKHNRFFFCVRGVCMRLFIVKLRE